MWVCLYVDMLYSCTSYSLYDVTLLYHLCYAGKQEKKRKYKTAKGKKAKHSKHSKNIFTEVQLQSFSHTCSYSYVNLFEAAEQVEQSFLLKIDLTAMQFVVEKRYSSSSDSSSSSSSTSPSSSSDASRRKKKGRPTAFD